LDANRTIGPFARRTTHEDIAIHEAAQRNLDAGVYEAGPRNPRLETGARHFHDPVRTALSE
jgi:hypothetical protein